MAVQPRSPGGPRCPGKGAGLDAAWPTIRALRDPETTFPRGPRAARFEPSAQAQDALGLYKGGPRPCLSFRVGGAWLVVGPQQRDLSHDVSQCRSPALCVVRGDGTDVRGRSDLGLRGSARCGPRTSVCRACSQRTPCLGWT